MAFQNSTSMIALRSFKISQLQPLVLHEYTWTINYIISLGAGGIGMSALVRYFNHYGKTVYGYDKTETDLTKQLQDRRRSITFQ
jgi:hypothetical protein